MAFCRIAKRPIMRLPLPQFISFDGERQVVFVVLLTGSQSNVVNILPISWENDIVEYP